MVGGSEGDATGSDTFSDSLLLLLLLPLRLVVRVSDVESSAGLLISVVITKTESSFSSGEDSLAFRSAGIVDVGTAVVDWVSNLFSTSHFCGRCNFNISHRPNFAWDCAGWLLLLPSTSSR